MLINLSLPPGGLRSSDWPATGCFNIRLATDQNGKLENAFHASERKSTSRRRSVPWPAARAGGRVALKPIRCTTTMGWDERGWWTWFANFEPRHARTLAAHTCTQDRNRRRVRDECSTVSQLIAKQQTPPRSKVQRAAH